VCDENDAVRTALVYMALDTQPWLVGQRMTETKLQRLMNKGRAELVYVLSDLQQFVRTASDARMIFKYECILYVCVELIQP
jgi:hypothetical protein